MFSLSRIVFASLLSVLAGIFIFFHFYGTVSVISTPLWYYLKVVDQRISPASKDDHYSVATKERKEQAALPPLPDISQYTVERIAAQAPPFSPGRVVIANMAGLPALHLFMNEHGRIQRLRLAQMSIVPKALVIQEGHYDLARLYEEIKQQSSDNFIEKRGSRYLLRLPLLISKGASLTISDKDTDEFLLSQEKAAFIVNAGDFFVLRTKITGWSEKEQQPAFFKDKLTYRPFLVSMGGGHMYIAGSAVANLGYQDGKSYGLTYSTCDFCLLEEPDQPRPTGALVGNMFYDMYFGFYSYEADDIAVIGNTYVNNIIYGIDPHDRSRRLIIAGNEVYGSRKKHGIILSREVNDSWIFNNYSHHNNGSGIMLDRKCGNNVIANNVAAHNQGDGLSFFESPDNTVYNNKIHQNLMSGVRIRNSWNINFYNDEIADNAGVPIVMYSADLENDPYERRDFVQDPYSMRTEASVFGAVIKRSVGKPAFKIDGINQLILSDLRLLSGSPVLSDILFLNEADIRKNIDTPEKMVVVARESARG